MELNEINNIVKDTESKLNEIKEMIADYEICKNITSKTYLLAAISKLATPFKSTLTIAR